MKKQLFTLLCVAFLGSMALAQSLQPSQVPSNVKKSLMTKYPKTLDLQWEKIGSNYQAQFLNGENWYAVVFTSAGEWVSTERYGEEKDLSTAVAQHIQANFSDGYISSVLIVEKPKTAKTYKIQIDFDDDSYELIYTHDGKLQSKTKTEYTDESED
jgi:hypothetical protein